MTDPFVGEIRQVGFNFAPVGWALCDGAFLPILSNTALFSIIGVQFGGDGRVSFRLPDLRGRFTLATGQGAGLSPYAAGESGGTETVTLDTDQMPRHTHIPQASSARGDRESPAGATWGQPHYGRASETAYAPSAPASTMSPLALGPQGGSRGHNNMPPYQVLNFIIALQGEYPQRP